MITDTREIIYTTNIHKESICAEIGVHRGINAQKIYKNKPKELHLIDCWDCQKEFFKENNIIPHSHGLACNEKQKNWYLEVKEIFNKNSNVNIIKMYSTEASKKFKNNYFDFIYIDGLHDYDSVLQDLKSWHPKLKNNGIIMCDDYEDRPERGYGVIPAIEKLLTLEPSFTKIIIKDRICILKKI